jgi:hypothetical protein
LYNKGPYGHELKKFAMNLNFYSNAAYTGVRRALKNILPHINTLKNWYRGIDGSPGFTIESIKAIKQRVQEESAKGNTIVVALSQDEVATRKHVIWCEQKKKYIGHVSFSSDITELASKALVFMATGVNTSWKVPLGYFYVNGFDGEKRAKLLDECLKFLHNGCDTLEVCSITFDGDGANLKMAEIMGANLTDTGTSPFFENPYSKKRISVILDVCHAVKLIRNNLAKKGVLHHGSNKIEWKYYEMLEKKQTLEGLHLGTKITPRHIDHTGDIMKVKLATQLFSESTAGSLEFCKISNMSGSEGCADQIYALDESFI